MGLGTSGSEVACQGLVEAVYVADSQIHNACVYSHSMVYCTL